jgi:hypothetical protein
MESFSIRASTPASMEGFSIRVSTVDFSIRASTSVSMLDFSIRALVWASESAEPLFPSAGAGLGPRL